MKENYMEQVEIERLALEKEISQFLAQSFLELDEGERQLMKRFGLTLTQYWALVHLSANWLTYLFAIRVMFLVMLTSWKKADWQNASPARTATDVISVLCSLL